MKYKIKHNDKLFNDIKILGARISLLGNIVQNDMIISNEQLEEFKITFIDLNKDLQRWFNLINNNIIKLKKEPQELIYNLRDHLILVDFDMLEHYDIGLRYVIITNDLDNLIYIKDEKIFNKAKELITITYSFKEVEEYYLNNK